MATVFDPNKDNSQNSNGSDPSQNQAQGSGTQSPPVVGGSGQSGSIDSSGGAASSSQQPQSSDANSSGRFVNIQNYINANKPASPDQSLASKIGQQITQVKQDNQNQFQQSQNQFNQSANANHAQYDQGLVNRVIQDPNAFIQQNQGQSAPTQDMTQFENMRSGTYQGPNGLTDYGDLQQKTQNFQDLTNQAATEGGRFNLLKSFFGNPNYTQGQQSLDNLLVQADPTQMDQLQGNRAQAAELARNLSSAQDSAQRTAQQYAQDNAAARTQLSGALGGEVSRVNTSLSQQAQAAQAAKDAMAQHYNDYLQKGYLDQDMMDKLGLSAGQNLYNVDPLQYLHESALNANAQNVASADDYARLQALGKLGGDALNTDAQSAINQFNDPTQAGAFNKDQAFQFDKDAFQNATQQAGDQYTQQSQPIQTNLDQANSAISGDLYVKGGLQRGIDTYANAIKATFGGNWGNMSGQDVINAAFASKDPMVQMKLKQLNQDPGMAQAMQFSPGQASAAQTAMQQGIGPWLVNQLAAEQQKYKTANDQFSQLKALFNPDKTLQMAPPSDNGGSA